MADNLYFALNGLLVGLSVGALLGMRVRDAYWISKSKDGGRANARGQMYFVIDASIRRPKGPDVR
jgi:hypothetical protein